MPKRGQLSSFRKRFGEFSQIHVHLLNLQVAWVRKEPLEDELRLLLMRCTCPPHLLRKLNTEKPIHSLPVGQ